MENLWKLEKEVAKIVSDLDNLEQFIADNEGEITPEIEALEAKILDGHLAETVARLVAADAHYQGREDAARITRDAAALQVKRAKKSQVKIRDLIAKLLEKEVDAGRPGKVWTSQGTASRVVRKSFQVWNEAALPERFTYTEVVTKYKKDEARKAAKSGENVPGVEQVTTVSAAIRRA
jgi:hypothetical protein